MDPTKWPIAVDSVNPGFPESSENALIHVTPSELCSTIVPVPFEFCPAARPLATIPKPPLPRVLQSIVNPAMRISESDSISSSIGETLNPDVPEFVPVVMTANQGEHNKPKADAEEFESIWEYPPSTNGTLPRERDDKTATKTKSVQVNGVAETAENDVWKEVKRRVKQPPKDKSEEKNRCDHKGEEREELDFQFDEELDTPPPTGRHNAFSEW